MLHELPAHYYNFTPEWIDQVMKDFGIKIVQSKPFGGVWTTQASHLFHFFLQAFRSDGFSNKEKNKRNAMFYILFPFMVIFAVLSMPICLFLGLGDLKEGATNYLVIVQK